MTALLDEVRNEIVELHNFFTEWFNGTAESEQLEERLISRLHSDFVYVPPEGTLLKREHLADGFQRGFGSNKDFRIQIRDVVVRHGMGNRVLATYTEWQVGAKLSGQVNNARVTTVLLEMGQPITWLHIQETWLPETVRAAGSFDF